MKLHVLVDDLDVARRAVDDGATVVQLRIKNATTDELVERGRPFRELPATFVVNDDVEAALALGADGVHLGQSDVDVHLHLAHERGLIVGLSAATVEQARAAQAHAPVYIGAGPVWPTPSKPDADPPTGVEGLAAICAAVDVPVIAIGGIDASNAADCIRAGAAGVAVIRAATEARALRAAIDAAL